jgi:hypothetical protein
MKVSSAVGWQVLTLNELFRAELLLLQNNITYDIREKHR